MSTHPDRPGLHGILAPAARLDRWLPVVLLVLVATSAVRYVDRHGLGVLGTLVLLGAAALVLGYSVLPGRGPWPIVRVAALVVLWALLTLVAPSFAWCAVPLAFAVLRAFPYAAAVATTVGMTLVVSAAWLRIVHAFDPTLVAGPVGIALVTLIAYRSLEQESQARQDLLDELTGAQAELAEEQHRSGALAERTWLSRDIHDSVGQGLSSINLLLHAADQAWDHDAPAARRHVRTAAATARDGLDEVRRVVRDLAPADLDGSGEALVSALRRTVLPTLEGGPAVEIRVHGEPQHVGTEIAAALVRTARGALANVHEHADARRAVVSLTFQSDEVLLDVRDDGRGFVVSRLTRQTPGSGRGRGLAGIAERAEALGGRAEVESTVGEGTTVSVSFPLEGP